MFGIGSLFRKNNILTTSGEIRQVVQRWPHLSKIYAGDEKLAGVDRSGKLYCIHRNGRCFVEDSSMKWQLNPDYQVQGQVQTHPFNGSGTGTIPSKYKNLKN